MDDRIDDCVSVIIPTYNVQQYLEKCLDSVCLQSHSHINAIVIDDGSIDDSGRICDEFAQTDSKIISLHTTNHGVSQAREIGINISTGRYITFLDADDFLDVDFCKKTLHCAKENKADWVSVNFSEVDGNHYESFKKIEHEIKITSRDEFVVFFLQHYFFTFVICGKLFRREMFEKYKFQRLKIGEDSCCMIDMIEKTSSAILCCYHGYYYVNRITAVTKISGWGKNQYDRWLAQKYISEVGVRIFKQEKNYFSDMALNAFCSTYKKMIQMPTGDEKRFIKKLLRNDLKNINLREEWVSSRMRNHIRVIKYLPHLYYLIVRAGIIR